MSGDLSTRIRNRAAMPFATLSLMIGLVAGVVAFAFGWMAVAWFLHLYRGGGDNEVVDACFQVVALLVISHGLTPEPSWNHPVTMLTAIASSWRIYGLPFSAVVLGVLAIALARPGTGHAKKTSLGAAARRFSVAGALLGGFEIAVLAGWLVVHRVVWG